MRGSETWSVGTVMRDRKSQVKTPYPGIVTLVFAVRQRDPPRTVPSAFHNVQVDLERFDRLEDHT